jgi:hypothetical protein
MSDVFFVWPLFLHSMACPCDRLFRISIDSDKRQAKFYLVEGLSDCVVQI